MARKEAGVDPGAGTAGPEIRAERAERKRFEDARRQCRIISDVRTRIDKSK